MTIYMVMQLLLYAIGYLVLFIFKSEVPEQLHQPQNVKELSRSYNCEENIWRKMKKHEHL